MGIQHPLYQKKFQEINLVPREIKLGTIWAAKKDPNREVQIVEVATQHVFFENLSDQACFSHKKIIFPAHYEYNRDKK